MTRTIRYVYFEATGGGPQSIKRHEQILAVVAQCDVACAARLMRRHYRAGRHPGHQLKDT